MTSCAARTACRPWPSTPRRLKARASIARDGKSVLIRGPSNIGWWLRNDAVDVEIAPSAHFDHGLARKAGQIVLKSQVRPEVGAKIRWKLTRAEG